MQRACMSESSCAAFLHVGELVCSVLAKDREVSELEADEIHEVVIKNVVTKPADKLRQWFNRFQDKLVGDHLQAVELQDEDDEKPSAAVSEESSKALEKAKACAPTTKSDTFAKTAAAAHTASTAN